MKKISVLLLCLFAISPVLADDVVEVQISGDLNLDDTKDLIGDVVELDVDNGVVLEEKTALGETADPLGLNTVSEETERVIEKILVSENDREVVLKIPYQFAGNAFTCDGEYFCISLKKIPDIPFMSLPEPTALEEIDPSTIIKVEDLDLDIEGEVIL